jgi:hypothetical protein
MAILTKTHSVFLCHNSKDRELVEAVKSELEQDKSNFSHVDFWHDQSKLPPGSPFDPIIKDAISKATLFIIFLGDSGIGEYQIQEIEEIKNRKNAVFIPVIITHKNILKLTLMDVANTLLNPNYGIKKIEYLLEINHSRKIQQKQINDAYEFLKERTYLPVVYYGRFTSINDEFIKKLKDGIVNSLKEIDSNKQMNPINNIKQYINHLIITYKRELILLGLLPTVIISLLGIVSFALVKSKEVIPSESSNLDSNNSSEYKISNYEIQPNFDLAGNFSNGVAPVRQDGQWRYIKRNGEFAFPDTFDGVLSFSKPEQLALAWKYKKNRGYISLTGKYKIQPEYGLREPAPFSEQMARVCPIGVCGYIGIDGNEIIARQFTGAGNFSEGLAPVRKDDKWGYIDPQGVIKIAPQFDEAHSFSEGLAPVRKENKWVYINQEGQVAFETPFEAVSNFSEGLAAVKLNNKWGYINKKGNIEIATQFDNPRTQERYKEFICDVVEINNTTQDKSQKINCNNLDERYDFSENLAAIYKDGKWGYINRQGQIFIKPQFLRANQFSERLAAVCIEENSQMKCGYINNPIKEPELIVKSLKLGFVRLRNLPSRGSKELNRVPHNTPVTILNQKVNNSGELWYEVKLNDGLSGWILSDYLHES